MKSVCEIVQENSLSLWKCRETDNGVRIRTTCIFPSFEPVFVYVAKIGDGFLVHDAGEAFAVIVNHGQDAEAARRVIRSECKRFDLNLGERTISLKIDAADWLETAIVTVANTAAASARAAIAETSAKSERDLADVIFQILVPRLPKGTITKSFPYVGESGRRYKFDLAVHRPGDLTLIETVTAHASSVNAKYVALADVPSDEDVVKIVAHNGDLSKEDILLLQNVAIVAGPEGVVDLLTGNRTIQ